MKPNHLLLSLALQVPAAQPFQSIISFFNLASTFLFSHQNSRKLFIQQSNYLQSPHSCHSFLLSTYDVTYIHFPYM